ncbi:polyprenyl diphosphate synthase [Glycomyces algeriensis]|uniref:Isoprenyl transferase n=1 Tax=Glycomyces algeriensis TaxID=256037 RepID=A0A9W6GBD2_9ACTN|nr:polyprenyl diphosphate synthase [Glycomyces algeriensis]MDA1367361.1 polyprenyl diphosphate synthase [Glycomyces algeriensis]MDR7350985.1 short-chain Z-isoprenyl diphosphate synthase [Glycomyces algeriensis]GLI43697.1 isoprenyl transferase [Glycomyces algeriensis]
MRAPRVLYRWYARRLRRKLDGGLLPGHVAVAMDGNRRWARQQGFDDPGVGHRYGAEHLEDLLDWCAGIGIGHVTVYVASQDNLTKRATGEVAHLMAMIEEIVAERLMRPGNRWRLHLAGRLDHLPDSTAHALKAAVEATSGRTTGHLTIAIGYDGQAEIVDAVKSLLEAEASRGTAAGDLAERLTASDIGAHRYTPDLPDADLIIRTSGERRLSSFLLWQSAGAELYFCDVYWPGFRQVDFLRALRDYARRRSA